LTKTAYNKKIAASGGGSETYGQQSNGRHQFQLDGLLSAFFLNFNIKSAIGFSTSGTSN
jgi:hypothetical protein